MRQSILAASVLLSLTVSGLACFRFYAKPVDSSEAPHSEKACKAPDSPKFVDGDSDTKLFACVRDGEELTCFEFLGFLQYVANRSAADAGVSL